MDLLIYEIWVLGIVSTWAWGCGTSQYLLPQFRANVGQQNHLDIGSGTGYYLRKGNIPRSTKLTLVDLGYRNMASVVRESCPSRWNFSSSKSFPKHRFMLKLRKTVMSTTCAVL